MQPVMPNVCRSTTKRRAFMSTDLSSQEMTQDQQTVQVLNAFNKN